MRLLAFCSLLFPLVLFAAPKQLNWKTGKITTDSTTGVANLGVANFTAALASHHAASDPNIVIIQGEDSIYTAREKHPWSGWCLLIRGEQMKYAEDGNRLLVVDSGGKKCRLDILNQEKRPAP